MLQSLLLPRSSHVSDGSLVGCVATVGAVSSLAPQQRVTSEAVEIVEAIEARAGGVKHRRLPRRRDRTANTIFLTGYVQVRSVTSLHVHPSCLHVAHVNQARVLYTASLSEYPLTIVLHERVQPTLLVHKLETLVMGDHHVVLAEQLTLLKHAFAQSPLVLVVLLQLGYAQLGRHDYSGGALLYLRSAGEQWWLDFFADHVLVLHDDGCWLRSGTVDIFVFFIVGESDLSVQVC